MRRRYLLSLREHLFPLVGFLSSVLNFTATPSFSSSAFPRPSRHAPKDHSDSRPLSLSLSVSRPYRAFCKNLRSHNTSQEEPPPHVPRKAGATSTSARRTRPNATVTKTDGVTETTPRRAARTAKSPSRAGRHLKTNESRGAPPSPTYSVLPTPEGNVTFLVIHK